MISIFFIDFFEKFKKNKYISLLIIFQIIIIAVILYITLYNYYDLEAKNKTAQIAWGEYEYYYISLNLYNPTLLSNLENGLYFSVLNINNDNYNEIVTILKNLEAFYEELNENDDIKTIVKNDFRRKMYLTENNKNWSEKDKVESDYGIFSIYEPENEKYSFNGFQISSNYIDFYDLKLSEGEFFDAEDYLYVKDYIPILMGEDFKKYYSLGEEFYANIWGSTPELKTFKFKVIGFIAKNQYFTTAGEVSKIYTYDNQIILPYLERPLEEYLSDEYIIFLNTFSQRILFSSNILIEFEKKSEVYKEFEELLTKYGLNEKYSIIRCQIQRELASNYGDIFQINIFVSIVAVVFSLLSIVFMMLYKLTGNIRNYAIHMLTGATQWTVTMYSAFEALILACVGNFAAYNIFLIYANGSGQNLFFNNYPLQQKVMNTGLLVNTLFVVVAVIIVAICILVKLKTCSLSMLIRGKEVKKDKSMPFYRAAMVFMFAILSVYMMFISSYYVAIDRIDMYYLGYNTKNVKMAYVMDLMQEEKPNIKVDFTTLGNDIIVNKYVTTEWIDETFLLLRGIYYNGDVPMIEMQKGRFLTEEECLGGKKIAVVGKEIYDKFVTVNEKGIEIFRYKDTNYEVIGIAGKEESVASGVDTSVFIPIGTAVSMSTYKGSYTLDGKNEAAIEALENKFNAQLSGIAIINITDYEPRITVEGPRDILMLMFVTVIINTAVFCVYYLSKQKHIMSVKKFIGYSPLMIFSDTFANLLSLAGISFLIGNAIILLLRDTILSEVELISLYTFDMQTLMFAIIGTAAMTLFFSCISITKTFSTDTSELIRG